MTNPQEGLPLTSLLSNRSWPDTEWDPEAKPVLIADGEVHSIKDLTAPMEVSAAYVVGVNEATCERLCRFVRTESLHFYEMRVTDLGPLIDVGDLRHLSIRWNTKCADLTALATLGSLETLVLEDTPNVHELASLSGLTNLRGLSFSGGMWNKNRAKSLRPLTLLPALEEVHLTNVAIEDEGLRPLAECQSLKKLIVSNQFAVDDFAFLSVRLPHVDCKMFAPFVRLEHEIDGKDVMVVGRRRPFLHSTEDAAKLAKYVERFEELQRGFAND